MLGSSDYKFEPAKKLATPQARAVVTRTVSFPAPGEYVVTLRAIGERDGVGRAGSTTPLINIDRVRVVVAGEPSTAQPGVGLAPLRFDLWQVDITRKRTQCVVDPRIVKLRRLAADKPARLRAYGPANSPSIIVEFPAGATIAAIDPAAFPIQYGSTMTVADAATVATIGQIDFAVLPAQPSDRKSLAEALKARGCTAQLALKTQQVP